VQAEEVAVPAVLGAALYDMLYNMFWNVDDAAANDIQPSAEGNTDVPVPPVTSEVEISDLPPAVEIEIDMHVNVPYTQLQINDKEEMTTLVKEALQCCEERRELVDKLKGVENKFDMVEEKLNTLLGRLQF